MTTHIHFSESLNQVTPTSPYFEMTITVSKTGPNGDYWGDDTSHVKHAMSIGGGPQVFNEYGELTGHALAEINTAKWFVEHETNGSDDAARQLMEKINSGLQYIARRTINAKMVTDSLTAGSLMDRIAV